jgi:signal transduction histidine kinase
MLQNVNVLMRTLVLVLAGVFTFLHPWPGAGYEALEITAFVIAVALVVPWTLAGSSPQRFRTELPYGLAVISLLCGAAYAAPDGGTMLAICFVVALSAGRWLSPERAWVVPALGVAGSAVVGLNDHANLWVATVYPFLLLMAAFVLGNNIRVHRVQAEHSAELLAEQAQVAMLQERARIAREIHDVLAHSLGALGLQIELVQAVLTDSGDLPRAVELLEQAHRMATSGLSETRQAVHALRDDALPLPEGLAELSVSHQRRHGAPVTFEVTGDPRPLPPDAGLAITRTAQEALVNTAKHAPHQPVAMRLDYGGDGTSLLVSSRLSSDPGESSFTTMDGGYGLAGLRERLLLLRGTLNAGRRGGDWVVEATVPR